MSILRTPIARFKLSLYFTLAVTMCTAQLQGQAIYVVGNGAALEKQVNDVLTRYYFKNNLVKRVTLFYGDLMTTGQVVSNSSNLRGDLKRMFSSGIDKNSPMTRESLRAELERVADGIDGNKKNRQKQVFYIDPILINDVLFSGSWNRLIGIESLIKQPVSKKILTNSIVVINGSDQHAEIELDENSNRISTSKPGVFLVKGTYRLNLGEIRGFEYRIGSGSWIELAKTNWRLLSDEEWEVDVDLRMKKSSSVDIRPIITGTTNSVTIQYDFITSLEVELMLPEDGGQAINCRQSIAGKIYKGFWFSIRSNIHPRELQAIFNVVYQSRMVVDLPHAEILLKDEKVFIVEEKPGSYCIFISFDKLFPGSPDCIDPIDKYSMQFVLDGELLYSSGSYTIGLSPFNLANDQIPSCKCD